jgi:general stress protein 26/ketosteroid isomerase-like protein
MRNSYDSGSREQIWQAVQAINRACRDGSGFAALAPLFVDQAVLVTPGTGQRAEGRDACLKNLEDFCSQVRFHTFTESVPQIDVFGSAAMVSYRYDAIWEFQGKRHEEDGRDVLAFVQDQGRWRAAWRTLLPGTRRTQSSAGEGSKLAETDQTGPEGVEQRCVALMETASACYLTAVDNDGFPQTTAMLNLRNTRQFPSLAPLYQGQKNDFLIYLTTGMQSPKLARIRANPKVSLYYCDPDSIHGLMLGGEIEIVSDPEIRNRVWQKGWTVYYPNGPEGPEYGVLRLAPSVAKGCCQGRAFNFDVREHAGRSIP